MDILIKAAQLILSLSILVILHEFGHFFFARLFNTRVEKFYLFFDAWFSLFKFKKGDTEYGIGWIPLGGYVKISGMIDESMDKEQMAQEPQPWEFRSKPAWQRLLIMVGGVVVNFIVAIIIFWMLLYVNGEQFLPVKNAPFGLYYSEVAHEIGLQDGDYVLKAGDIEIQTPNDIVKHIILEDCKILTVKRGDSVFTLPIPADYKSTLIASGRKSFANYRMSFVVDTVLNGMNAQEAGIIENDSIVSINGEPAGFYNQFVSIIENYKDKTIDLVVKRDTALVAIACKVNSNGQIGVRAKLGSLTSNVETVEYGFFEAFPAGVIKGSTVLVEYVKQLPLIFTKEGAKQIGGFGTIGSLFPATWDWTAFWSMTAFLSIILAFMNILPIPALDGGHVMFLLYEIITRRKPSEKFMEYAQIAGMVLLLGLLIFANGNDLFRMFTKN